MSVTLTWLLEKGLVLSPARVNTNWKRIATHEELAAIWAHVHAEGFASLSELVWNLANPGARLPCEHCGGVIAFNRSTYNRFCSRQCAGAAPSTKLQRDRTNLARWNTTSPASAAGVKLKAKQTLLQRYGAAPAHHVNQPRYTEMMLQKYGVPTPMHSAELIHRAVTVRNENFNDRITTQNTAHGFTSEGVLNSRDQFSFTCQTCGTISEARVWMNRPPRCFTCQPHVISSQHLKVRMWLSAHGYAFIENTRKIIKPLELDFYLPEHALAIEVNGLYWHSEAAGTENGYHLRKTLECHQLGIALVHLFEDELDLRLETTMERVKAWYLEPRRRAHGMIVCQGTWPLPIGINAVLIDRTAPEQYKIDPNFRHSVKTPVWDCGTFTYQGLDEPPENQHHEASDVHGHPLGLSEQFRPT